MRAKRTEQTGIIRTKGWIKKNTKRATAARNGLQQSKPKQLLTRSHHDEEIRLPRILPDVPVVPGRQRLPEEHDVGLDEPPTALLFAHRSPLLFYDDSFALPAIEGVRALRARRRAEVWEETRWGEIFFDSR